MPSTLTSDVAYHDGQIRKVMPVDTGLVRSHLLRLDAASRRRRFSHHVSDAYIAEYALDAVTATNLAFAFYQGGEIRALAELKRADWNWGGTAEAAFSVEQQWTDHGIATQLMGLIIQSARNRGIRHLMLYCHAENAKMRAIARHYDADLRIEPGAIVADILPRRLDFRSVRAEFIANRVSAIQSLIAIQLKMMQARETDERH